MTTSIYRILLLRKGSDEGKALSFVGGTSFEDIKSKVAQKFNIEDPKRVRLFTQKGSKLFEIEDTTEIFHDDVLIVSDGNEKQEIKTETMKLTLKILNGLETKDQQVVVSKDVSLKEALSGFELNRYSIVVKGKELQSDTMVNTLRDNEQIYLVYKPVCLSFLTPSGRIVKLYVSTQDTISAVKKQLSIQEQFQKQQQRYFYKGVELKDDVTVGECNISEDVPIQLKLEYSFC